MQGYSMGVRVARFVFPRGRDGATAVNVGRQILCLNPLSLRHQRPRSRISSVVRLSKRGSGIWSSAGGSRRHAGGRRV